MTAALKPWDFTAVLVDDEEPVLRAMFRDLRDEGFGVVAFSDAAAALEALQALHRRGELPLDRAERHTYDVGPPPDAVDILIADVRMPGLTGIDLLTRANDLFPDALRFVLTGYADIKDAVDAINRARARYYFTKPWTYAEIRRLLFHYLEAYRIESDRRRLKRVAAEGLAQVARDLARLETDLQDDLGHAGLTEDMKTQILGLDLQKRVLQHLQFLHHEHFPAVQRVLRLVAYLERLERAALTLRYERTFLPALVREAYDRLSDAYRAKPVTIHLDLNLPRADVLADEPILADAAEFLLGFALE
ncbi:MAG: response regulator, partial [Candidatus Methylomirabilis sp.]|nr:response regulator [Deltaproteobacteria bacterium]